jgi:hypothetical protein
LLQDGSWAATEVRQTAARCRHHIDALYVLALLHRGESHLAEEAVIQAVVCAASDPVVSTADLGFVWRLLAVAFEAGDDRTVDAESPAAVLRGAALSTSPLETMALTANGRQPHEVAALLHLRTTQVRDEFNSGTRGLVAALQSVVGSMAAAPQETGGWATGL